MPRKLLLLCLIGTLYAGLLIGFTPAAQAQATTKLYIQVRANPQWWNGWMKNTNHSCAWGSLQGAIIAMELQGGWGTFYRTEITNSYGNIVLDVLQNQTVTLKSATAIYNVAPIKMKQTNPSVRIGTGSVYYLNIDMVSRDVPETVKLSGRIVYKRLIPYVNEPLHYKNFTVTGACGAKSVSTDSNGYFPSTLAMWPNQLITITIPNGMTPLPYGDYTQQDSIGGGPKNVGEINVYR